MEDPKFHNPAAQAPDKHTRCPAPIDPSLDLMIFVKSEPLPAEMSELCILRRTLDCRLLYEFSTRLTDAEAKLFSAQGLSSATIRHKWDEMIIEATGRYGTLMLLSDRVLVRVHAWRTGLDNGAPDLPKLERFLNAILEEAKIRGGLKQEPLTEAYARMKPQAVAELKKLQVELRRSAAQKPEEVIALVRHLMTPQQYPGLSVNRNALLIFLEFNPRTTMGFGRPPDQLSSPDEFPIDPVSATQFYYQFVAYCTNRDPETVRQTISRLSAMISRRELHSRK